MKFQASVLQLNTEFSLNIFPSNKQYLYLPGRKEEHPVFTPNFFVYLEFLSKVLSAPSLLEVICLIH